MKYHRFHIGQRITFILDMHTAQGRIVSLEMYDVEVSPHVRYTVRDHTFGDLLIVREDDILEAELPINMKDRVVELTAI